MQLGNSGAIRHGIASRGAIPTDASAGISRSLESNALVPAGEIGDGSYSSSGANMTIHFGASSIPEEARSLKFYMRLKEALSIY
jgi:hypothetical protein